MFTIEKSVPIPVPGTVKTGVTNALKQMNVGDSVLIPMGVTNRNRLSSRFSEFAKTKAGAGKRFTQRKTPDGYRIWRIA